MKDFNWLKLSMKTFRLNSILLKNCWLKLKAVFKRDKKKKRRRINTLKQERQNKRKSGRLGEWAGYQG